MRRGCRRCYRGLFPYIRGAQYLHLNCRYRKVGLFIVGNSVAKPLVTAVIASTAADRDMFFISISPCDKTCT